MPPMPFISLTDRQPTPAPVSCSNCALGRFTIYGATAQGDPNAVNTRRREVLNFPAGRIFLREGKVQKQVYTLYSGWAFRYVTLSDGRRQIFQLHLPGDMLAQESLLMPGIQLPFSVRSLTPVTLCAFDVAEAVGLIHHSQEQEDRSRAEMRRFFAGLHRRLADIGRRSALGRLAQLLIETEQRLLLRGLSQNSTFLFPVSQEHIADMLGLTTVYVNRTLDRLRKQKIITFDRKIMRILDSGRLYEIAEEE